MSLNLSNLRALVVEDAEPMSKLIVSLLDAFGVGHIYSESTADHAFISICRYNPHIIFTDWNLPTTNGIDLVERIRASVDSPNPRVPVIMITGYSAKKRVALARDKGVTEFMAKPFSAETLAQRLAHAINQPRAFIRTKTFFGPDRRRNNNDEYFGPMRRNSDKDIVLI